MKTKKVAITAGRITNEVQIKLVLIVSNLLYTKPMAIETPSMMRNDARRVILGTKLHLTE